MKRILSIISNNIEAGGVEFYLCKVWDKIDLHDIRIDLLVPGHVVSSQYADILTKIGCSIIELNINEQGIQRYIKLLKSLRHILKEHSYDVLHVNTGALFMEAIALTMGSEIPIRIAHSHGTVIKRNALMELCRDLLRMLIVKNATYMLACSKSAAISLYGKKYADKAIIAKNGIEVETYRFNGEIRKRIRQNNGWNNQFVIGCVGRIAWEKNHKYLLQIFDSLHEKYSSSRLVIIGTGTLEGEIKEQANKLGLEKNIQFMGVRTDVNELVQGLDVFVLPSIREALGIVNIEAQASGLHCIVSDVVPGEVNVTGLVDFLSIHESPELWANKILEYNNGYERKDTTQIIKNQGFDLSASATIIDQLYHSEIKKGRICEKHRD